MASYIQLTAELTKLIPIDTIIKTSAVQLWNLARSLRNSGSDILVERDLADIFGRAIVHGKFEKTFRDAVNIHRVVPLFDGDELELDVGVGPTVQRAFKETEYMATVIQLSFLAWIHNREQLGDLIVSSMRKRSEVGIGSGFGAPGVDDVMKTLTACSSQTSSFNWSYYSGRVQEKLRSVIPTYQYSADYTRLSPALFLGALDFLFVTQRFPDDRRIFVSNEIGSISMIIWAHYILGMTVSVTGKVSRPITFGDCSTPHMTIEWTMENREFSGEITYPNSWDDALGPDIILLDQSMEKLIRCTKDYDAPVNIAAEDRHPLLGWGQNYLERVFNTTLLTSDNDPIYEEMATIVTAIALNISQRLDYGMRPPAQRIHNVITDSSDSSAGTTSTDIARKSMCLEFWRVMEACTLIFDGTSLNKNKVDEYLKRIQGKAFTTAILPTTLTVFLEKIENLDDFEDEKPAEKLLNQCKYLVGFVALFSFVINVKDCESLPLRMSDHTFILHDQLSLLFDDPNSTATIGPTEIFHAIAKILSGTHLKNTAEMNNFEGLFLYSDFGWSILFDTERNIDPAEASSHLLHIVPGTPTNIQTKERKYILRDGVDFYSGLIPPSFLVSGQKSSVLPRCAGKAIKQRKYWASRKDEFQLTLRTLIKPSPEWHNMIKGTEQHITLFSDPDSFAFEVSAGYRKMQECLWYCYLTKRCKHAPDNLQAALTVGPDVAEVMGFDTRQFYKSSEPFRVIILHTSGDPNVRWYAIIRNAAPGIRDQFEIQRRTMLRSPQCCGGCALSQAIQNPGKWLLIL